MRPAGQERLGYYPIPKGAVTELVKHLRVRPREPEKKYSDINILDGCAGEGAAIQQLARAMGVPDEHLFTVELDPGRSEIIETKIPKGRHLGNTSFLGMECTGSSFGLIYVNPPFDDELGGGRREEQAFVEAATPLLVPRGVIVLVCPITALAGNKRFCGFLDASYEDIRVYRFPDGVEEDGTPTRRYKEVVVLGRKRKEVLPKDSLALAALHQMQLDWRGYFQITDLPALGKPAPAAWNCGTASKVLEPFVAVYETPHSRGPNTFRKGCFTIDELNASMESSPLNDLFQERPARELGKPPLALSRGHLGLTLASGQLDGRVTGPYGTHVVRGSSFKLSTIDPSETVSTVNPESGAVTTKETWRERMITCIRCTVDYPTPQIYTFSNAEKEATVDFE